MKCVSVETYQGDGTYKSNGLVLRALHFVNMGILGATTQKVSGDMSALVFVEITFAIE